MDLLIQSSSAHTFRCTAHLLNIDSNLPKAAHHGNVLTFLCTLFAIIRSQVSHSLLFFLSAPDHDPGRISPVHRSSSAVRQIVFVHVVQSAGGQTKVLQKARQEDERRGGTSLQARITGTNYTTIDYTRPSRFDLNLYSRLSASNKARSTSGLTFNTCVSSKADIYIIITF